MITLTDAQENMLDRMNRGAERVIKAMKALVDEEKEEIEEEEEDDEVLSSEADRLLHVTEHAIINDRLDALEARFDIIMQELANLYHVIEMMETGQQAVEAGGLGTI